jgi:FkbM family methyltransferase
MIDPYNIYIKESFTKFIDVTKVKTILEIGARECGYTQEILDFYSLCEELHSFECNPHTVSICEQNIKDLKKNHKNLKKVKFNAKGVSSKEEELTFFSVNVGGDYGSSSAGFFPTEKQHSLIKEDIKVKCIDIDTYCKENNIDKVDMILIDIEGGELKAFQGAINTLKNVSYIIAEVQDVQRNENTPLRKDINDFLKQYNFKEMYTTCNLEKGQIFGDSIYVKQ